MSLKRHVLDATVFYRFLPIAVKVNVNTHTTTQAFSSQLLWGTHFHVGTVNTAASRTQDLKLGFPRETTSRKQSLPLSPQSLANFRLLSVAKR